MIMDSAHWSSMASPAESTARHVADFCAIQKKDLYRKRIQRNRKKTTETTGIASADPESGRQGGLLYSNQEENLVSATVTAFHIQCSTGMRAENAIHVPKKTFSKVFAPWQNCISACIYRL